MKAKPVINYRTPKSVQALKTKGFTPAGQCTCSGLKDGKDDNCSSNNVLFRK